MGKRGINNLAISTVSIFYELIARVPDRVDIALTVVQIFFTKRRPRFQQT